MTEYGWNGWKLNKNGEKVLDGDEYGTPVWLIDDAQRVFGNGWDLDMYSSDWHQQRLGGRFPDYCTKQNPVRPASIAPINAWANPPYSAPLLTDLVRYWMCDVVNGVTHNAFLLVPASTSTRWAQDVLEYPHCFLGRRVAHHHPTLAPDEVVKGTRHDSMLIYAGPHYPQFKRIFSQHGRVQ